MPRALLPALDQDAGDPDAVCAASRSAVEGDAGASRPPSRQSGPQQSARRVARVRPRRGLSGGGVDVAVAHPVPLEPAVGLQLLLAVEVDEGLIVDVATGLEQVLRSSPTESVMPWSLLVGADEGRQPRYSTPCFRRLPSFSIAEPWPGLRRGQGAAAPASPRRRR